ncbi:uncharacterized protein [Chamaea fasciata]|uniref:uncharacterized protein isoform X2 n=1 Tax=Chamaea fasciata TaxID=190680 RepID=UPI00336A21BF
MHSSSYIKRTSGLDLAVSTTTTISDISVHLTPTGLHEPLPFKCHALLLGRSSPPFKSGIFILLGIINSDSRGEVKIIAWTPNPPCTIPAGSCIAQLIPLILLPDMQSIPSVNADRDNGGFGSTGTSNICWSKLISVQQPFLTCVVDGKSFSGLPDTEAGITTISKREWPPTWPLTPAAIVAGIRGQQVPQQSAKELMVFGPEGEQARLTPSHSSLPGPPVEGNAVTDALMTMATVPNPITQAKLLQEFYHQDTKALTQGQGCEDFDGMCCMTLSDHSESIHKSIQKLKELSGELQQNLGWDPFSLFSWMTQTTFLSQRKPYNTREMVFERKTVPLVENLHEDRSYCAILTMNQSFGGSSSRHSMTADWSHSATTGHFPKEQYFNIAQRRKDG